MPSNPEPTRSSALNRGLLAAGLLASLIVGVAIVSASLANAGGWFGHRHHGDPDPERMRAHAEFAVGWALDHVDASEEQETRVQEIVRTLVDDLAALGTDHRANRDALLAELSQPTVDAAALESIRQSELALANAASLELIEAVEEISEVLTPEQRAELLELASNHRH